MVLGCNEQEDRNAGLQSEGQGRGHSTLAMTYRQGRPKIRWNMDRPSGARVGATATSGDDIGVMGAATIPTSKLWAPRRGAGSRPRSMTTT